MSEIELQLPVPMNIRPATHSDIPALCALYTEFFAYNAAQQPWQYVAAQETGEYPLSVINSKSGEILVAEENGAVIGFVHLEEDTTPPYPSVSPHNFACIVDLIVSERHRRKGTGQLLLEECKRWARARGLEYIELMVLENNSAGISFYEHERFVTASRTMRLAL